MSHNGPCTCKYAGVPYDLETSADTLRMAAELHVTQEVAFMLIVRLLLWGYVNADANRRVCSVGGDSVDIAVGYPGFFSAAKTIGLLTETSWNKTTDVLFVSELLDSNTKKVRLEKLKADAARKARSRQGKPAPPTE